MNKTTQFYLLVLATTATASLTVMGADSYSRLRCLSSWADRFEHAPWFQGLGENSFGAAVQSCNGGGTRF